VPFGIEKLEWFYGDPMVKKFEDIFIRFDMIHERDRHTHTETPHDGVGGGLRSLNKVLFYFVAFDGQFCKLYFKNSVAKCWYINPSIISIYYYIDD